MERTLIKGNKALAETLGVHFQTVQQWRSKGLLKDATMVERGRVIIYDLDKVFECLKYRPVSAGRRRAI
ncbi:MAG: DUF3853 family protein [Bacteroidales bacterium]|nr:DUF3853 family protein [Bacteroidales bacterium]